MALIAFIAGIIYLLYGLALWLVALTKRTDYGAIIEDYILIAVLIIGGILMSGFGFIAILFEF